LFIWSVDAQRSILIMGQSSLSISFIFDPSGCHTQMRGRSARKEKQRMRPRAEREDLLGTVEIAANLHKTVFFSAASALPVAEFCTRTALVLFHHVHSCTAQLEFCSLSLRSPPRSISLIGLFIPTQLGFASSGPLVSRFAGEKKRFLALTNQSFAVVSFGGLQFQFIGLPLLLSNRNFKASYQLGVILLKAMRFEIAWKRMWMEMIQYFL
jgi:hypothetical protein